MRNTVVDFQGGPINGQRMELEGEPLEYVLVSPVMSSVTWGVIRLNHHLYHREPESSTMVYQGLKESVS